MYFNSYFDFNAATALWRYILVRSQRFEATNRKSNLDFINNVDDWQEIKMGLDCDKETL